MKEKNRKLLLIISGVASVVAGILHATIVAFEHVAPLPLETVFFAVTGVLQIVLGVLIVFKARVKFIASLFVLNGMLASAWILTRIFRAPFMTRPEEVSTLGIIVFSFELLAMIMIGIWKWVEKERIHEVHGYSFTHVISALLLIALVSGSSVFGGGRLGEVVMPDRTLEHAHGHGGGGHSQDEKNHEDQEGKGNHKMPDMHDNDEESLPVDNHGGSMDDHHDDEVPH